MFTEICWFNLGWGDQSLECGTSFFLSLLGGGGRWPQQELGCIRPQREASGTLFGLLKNSLIPSPPAVKPGEPWRPPTWRKEREGFIKMIWEFGKMTTGHLGVKQHFWLMKPQN